MQPLNRAFNVAVQHIASKLLPLGFDVGPVAPSTLVELTEHVAKTGRILVWDGASDATIFACAETNYAFRAWHDWTHWRYQLTFDRAGEYEACRKQCDDLRKLYGDVASAPFRRLVGAEIIGQFEYKETWGEFPTDQMAFTRAYLTGFDIGAVFEWLASPQFR